MPDVDDFYYVVRGPGSRTLVNLALGGAPLDEIVYQAELMAVKAMNQPRVRRVLCEVNQALLQAILESGYTLARLRAQLRACKRQGAIAAIGAQAAEAVFCSAVSGGSEFDAREIQERFLKEFAGDLIEGRALNHARERLIRSNTGTVGQHYDWIASVRENLASRMPRLLESVFNSDRIVRRQPRPRPSTQVLLNRRVA